MPKWLEWTLVLAITAAGAGLRLYGLDRESFWLDEYRQASSYSLPLPQVLDASFRLQRQTPLDYLIGWTVYQIDRSDFALRLPSAIFGALSIPLLYLLARRLFSSPAALVAAATLAVSVLHVRYSQQARPYAIFVFFYLAALLLLLRAWRRNDWWSWLLFGASAELMLLSRAFGPVVMLTSMWVAALALSGGELWRRWRTGGFTRHPTVRLTLCAVVLAVLYLPVLARLVHYERARAYSALLGEPRNVYGEPSGFAYELPRNTGVWFTSMQQSLVGWWQVKVAFLLLGAGWLAIGEAGRSRPQRVVWVSMLMGGVLYLLALSGFVMGKANSRYFLFLGPLYAMLLGVGLVEAIPGLIRRMKGHTAVGGVWALACLAFVLGTGGHMSVASLRCYMMPDWRGCAEFLNTRLQPGDAIFVFHDRRFGRSQREFLGDRYLDQTPAICGALWDITRNDRLFEQARAAPAQGRAYLVLHHYAASLFGPQQEFFKFGIQHTPPGVGHRKFRRLDLVWFEQPLGNVWYDVYEFSTLLLNNRIGHRLSPRNKAHVMLLLLRARLLLTYDQPDRALAEYRLAEQLCPTDQRSYFLRNSRTLRQQLGVKPAW